VFAFLPGRALFLVSLAFAAASASCTSKDGKKNGSAGGGGGESVCAAAATCRTVGESCTDSFGLTCTCIEKLELTYLECAPNADGAGSSGGSGGEGGAPGTSGGGAVDPTSSTKECAGDAPWVTSADAPLELTVDAAERVAPWSRYYEKGVAADHANTVLTTAWGRNIQNALKKGHDLAGFEYARFHGILNDDIAIYSEERGQPVYDFTRFDQVYDAVVAAGMRPVVEISFTPTALATDEKAQLHWYGGTRANISKPKDWVKWRRFMAAIVQHLEARYGVEEVRQNWWFEVWNEASWMYSEGEGGYMELYKHTVLGLRAGDPEVKVGGPAASAASSVGLIPSLVGYAGRQDLGLDFVTWHRYGNDEGEQNRADANGMLAYFERLSGIIEDTGFTGLSLNDEWGASYDPDTVRDNEVSASFVAKTVHLIGTSPNYPPPYMFGYWTISDLYEEINTGERLAYREGNYGMMLKGDANIPVSFDVEKPVFNAFRLLHLLGDVRLSSSGGTVEDGVNLVATAAEDGSAVQVLVYNHVNGGRGDSESSELVSLTVENLPFDTENVAVKHYMVDRVRSNSFRAWYDMGRPMAPTEEQWVELADAAMLCYYPTTRAIGSGRSFTITYPENVYGVSLFVLTPE
jgi:xylan 1,4-beta-xylosidase